eukprot:scaffold135304_cov50-Attheya_sp.AAC.2
MDCRLCQQRTIGDSRWIAGRRYASWAIDGQTETSVEESDYRKTGKTAKNLKNRTTDDRDTAMGCGESECVACGPMISYSYIVKQTPCAHVM